MKVRLTSLLARAGYVSRGSVYLIIGVMAVAAAFGGGRNPSGTKDALKAVFAQPLGTALVALIAAGLLCFSVWRGAQSIFDADRIGFDGPAFRKRMVQFLSGIIYLSLAGSAITLIMGYKLKDDGQNARDWTSYLMSLPAGRVIILIIGIAVICAGFRFIWKSWTGEIGHRLKADASRNLGKLLGRTGHLARGVVFAIAGGGLLVASYKADPAEAHGLGEALFQLQQQPFGPYLYGATALGLFAFGAFQIFIAIYRDIHPPTATGRSSPSFRMRTL